MKPQMPFVAVGLFALTTLFSLDAFACRCTERVGNPAKKAELGFWGTAKSIDNKGAADRVLFSVDQVFRGDADKESVQVWASRYEHDCGIRFEEGKKYVIYAYSFYPRGVATSQCWMSYQSDEPPTEEAFFNPKSDIRKPFELETKVRVMAKKIVPNCSSQARVRDAAWSMILSPGGDPVAAPLEKKIAPRDQAFRDCILEAYRADSSTPTPESPVRMEGYYQSGASNLPSLVDQLDCGDDCPTWEKQVLEMLLAIPGGGGDGGSAVLAAARTTCMRDGVDAASSELNQGRAVGSAEQRRRQAMLLGCAASRGEMDRIDEFLDSAPNEQYKAAVLWVKSNAGEGEMKYPLRSGAPTFADFWFEEAGPPSAGKFRVLRSGFIEDPMWAFYPVFLEAFAEAIVADSDANQVMRDFAALAYAKAGFLRPEQAEEYRRLANDASESPEARAMQKELREKFTASAPVAEAPEEEEFDEVAALDEGPVDEAEGGGVPADVMWYALGGLVVLVGGAGAAQRFKKR